MDNHSSENYTDTEEEDNKKNALKRAENRKYTKIDGVEGKVKRFNKDLHSKYDIKAREVTKAQLGSYVEDNPDIYGVDMFLKCDKFPYKNLELQVCAEWKEYEFPYKYPFIYARKMKYGNDTMFMTYNYDFTQVLIFDRESICPKPARLKKYSREVVNTVPWNRVLRFTVSKMTIEDVRLYVE